LHADEIPDYIGDVSEPTLVEVGCCDGEDTERFLNSMPKARIYAFEPDVRCVRKLKARFNAATVGDLKRKNIHLTQAAVADRDGACTLYRSSGKPPGQPDHDGDWHMSSSIFRPTGHFEMSPWTTFPEAMQTMVNTVRLDSWIENMPEIEVIDFMWADVQGAERALIQGGSHTLKAKIRWFYTEYYNTEMYEGQPDLNEIVQMLKPEFKLHTLYHTDNALFQNVAICS
jgi:FkbM family methyltransferase